MRAEVRRIPSDLLRAALHDERDGFGRQAIRRDTAVPIDRPEDRSFDDGDGVEPAAQGAHGTRFEVRTVRDADQSAGALLVGLRPPKVDLEAALDEPHVADVERYDLRAAHRGREADQKQCAITQGQRIVAERCDDRPQVVGEDRRLARLRDAEPTPNASHDGRDLRVRMGALESGFMVRGGNR